MKLVNKVALITGGGRGIGKAIALKFAEEGASVCLCSRSFDELKKVARIIEKLNRNVLVVKADISKEKDIQKVVSSTIKKFGQIDILVNNAGVSGPHKSIDDLSYKEWLRTMKINVDGVFLCSKAILPFMKKRSEGKIINISSVAGKKGSGFMADYCASKAAVISFTQSLATEVGRSGISVNALCPGIVATKMSRNTLSILAKKMKFKNKTSLTNHLLQSTPLGRFVTDAEVAHTALFLASDASSGITGEAITVSAGVFTS